MNLINKETGDFTTKGKVLVWAACIVASVAVIVCGAIILINL